MRYEATGVSALLQLGDRVRTTHALTPVVPSPLTGHLHTVSMSLPERVEGIVTHISALMCERIPGKRVRVDFGKFAELWIPRCYLEKE